MGTYEDGEYKNSMYFKQEVWKDESESEEEKAARKRMRKLKEEATGGKRLMAKGKRLIPLIGSEILLFGLFIRTEVHKMNEKLNWRHQEKYFTKIIYDEDVDFYFLKENGYGAEAATQALFLAYKKGNKVEEEKDVAYRCFVETYVKGLRAKEEGLKAAYK